ncbi:hypothetical protein [Allorhizobium undicola]|uniref:hypothetical protein n=1 Tax=Allorhizobium undicola TaxID=78527 RepID=UPI000485C4F9|nr:hypothetical protein [Allorhizobium undicola]
MSETRTQQEIFDIVYRGLAAQGFRRSERNYRSAYRGEGGLKCSIGHLIPDARYVPELEGRATTDPLIREVAGIEEANAEFMEDLQAAHDASDAVEDTPTYMRKRLEMSAAKYNLVIPS